MCVATIRNSTDYSSPDGTNLYCDGNHFVDFNNQYKCITDCPGPRLTGTHPDYGEICVTNTQCTAQLSWFVDGAYCVNTCPPGQYFNVPGGNCVVTCPGGTVYSPTAMECLASCPTTPTLYLEKVVDNTCVTKPDCIGPEELYASLNDNTCRKPCVAPNDLVVPSVLECEDACPSSPTMTYKLISNSSCETQPVCSAITTPAQHYSDPSVQLCATSCSASLYHYDVDYTCLTAAECKAISGRFIKDTPTKQCVDKTECTTATFFTDDDIQVCVSACPGTHYHYDVDSTCLTAAECKAIPGRFIKDTPIKECVDKADCTTASFFTDDDIDVCIPACPGTHYTYDVDSTCLTAAECKAISGRFIKDTPSKVCIDKPDCTTATFFTDDDLQVCISACPGTHYHYDVDSTCLTAAECKAISGRFVKDTPIKECVDKADCTTATFFTDDDNKVCAATCPASEYKYTPTFECKTDVECYGFTDYYTKDDTMDCILNTDCVNAGYFKVDPARDCVTPCPGTHPYLHDASKVCKSLSQCQLMSHYTRLDTNFCVSATDCDNDSRYKVEPQKDCASSCPVGTYHYDVDFTCKTQAECQAIPDFFTHNTTNYCLSSTDCLSGGRLLVPSYADCMPSPCPWPDYWFHSGSSSCLTQTECQGVPSYTNNLTKSCIPSCPNPLYHNEEIKDCDSSCPTGLYGTTSAPFECLTDELCVNKGPAFWVIPSTMTCEDSCSLKKEEKSRYCQVSCPIGETADSRCFENFGITVSSTVVNTDSTITIELTLDQSNLNIDNTLISSIEAIPSTGPTVSITNFVLSVSGTTATLQIQDLLTPETYDINVSFDLAKEVYSQTTNTFPLFDSLFFASTASLSTTVVLPEEPQPDPEPSPEPTPAEPSPSPTAPTAPTDPQENITELEDEGKVPGVIEILISTHSLIIKFIPVLAPLFSLSPSSNFLTYLAQTFNKLLIYSFFNFKMDPKIDLTYLIIFKDLMDEISETFVDWIKPGTSEEDMNAVCTLQNWRFCHVKVTCQMLTSQSIIFVFFFLMVIIYFIFKFFGQFSKACKSFSKQILEESMPNMWLGNQLQLFFVVLDNMVIPLFTTWIMIMSFVSSVFLILSIIVLVGLLSLSKKFREHDYFNRVKGKIFEPIFRSKNTGVVFSVITTVFDTMMAICILFFLNQPIKQTFAWLVGEAMQAYLTIKFSPFKNKFFLYRTNVISIMFVILSVLLVMLNSFPKFNYFFSVSVLIISSMILVLDMICSFILMVMEIIEKCKKLGGKKKKSSITISRQRVKSNSVAKNRRTIIGQNRTKFRKRPNVLNIEKIEEEDQSSEEENFKKTNRRVLKPKMNKRRKQISITIKGKKTSQTSIRDDLPNSKEIPENSESHNGEEPSETQGIITSIQSPLKISKKKRSIRFMSRNMFSSQKIHRKKKNYESIKNLGLKLGNLGQKSQKIKQNFITEKDEKTEGQFNPKINLDSQEVKQKEVSLTGRKISSRFGAGRNQLRRSMRNLFQK